MIATFCCFLKMCCISVAKVQSWSPPVWICVIFYSYFIPPNSVLKVIGKVIFCFCSFASVTCFLIGLPHCTAPILYPSLCTLVSSSSSLILFFFFFKSQYKTVPCNHLSGLPLRSTCCFVVFLYCEAILKRDFEVVMNSRSGF